MKLFDLHCDTVTECYLKKQGLFDNELSVSLKKGAALNKWIQVFAIWMPDEYRGDTAWNYFNNVYNYFKNQLQQYDEYISLCTGYRDIINTIKAKKCTALLAVEGGSVLSGELEKIELLAKLGVKLLTLTWNEENEIASGISSKEDRGLTSFGKKAVPLLEQNNIIPDVSHLSEKSFYDLCLIAKKPFIASHSNSYSVYGHKRNLSDDQFKEIVTRKGIVGVNFFHEHICDKGADKTRIEDLFLHIEHFLSLGGEKSLCIGSDYDGATVVSRIKSVDKIYMLADFMLRQNLSQRTVDDILFNNALEFFRGFDSNNKIG